MIEFKSTALLMCYWNYKEREWKDREKKIMEKGKKR